MTLPSTTFKTVFTSDTQYAGSFSAALLDAGAHNATLVIDSLLTLHANAAVTVPLVFAGGKIALNDFTLSISELIAAPLNQQIFDLANTPVVNLTVTTLRTPLTPEMFGGGTSGQDNLLAFNAIAALAGTNGGATMILGPGAYSISDQPTFDDKTGLFIQGAGVDKTTVQRSTGGTSNPVLWFKSATKLVQSGGITGCAIDANGIAAYCMRQTSCQQMSYSNLLLTNATTSAWYWDCVDAGNRPHGPNQFCVTTGVTIDLVASNLPACQTAGGLYIGGGPGANNPNNTGQCTFIQLHISAQDGDALTLGFCGDNSFYQCATFSSGRGVVLARQLDNQGNPLGTPDHNLFFGLQTAGSRVWAFAGSRNFAILDTGNSGDANPPLVMPGAEFNYINEIFFNNLIGYGVTSTDAATPLGAEFPAADDYILWRQQATFNTTATFPAQSSQVTVSSSAGILVGMYATDITTGHETYIPVSTRVTLVAGNLITLSAPTSGQSTGTNPDTLSFSFVGLVNTTGSPQANSTVVPVASTVGIVEGMQVADLTHPSYISAGTTVSSVTANVSVTLSSKCSGTPTTPDHLTFVSNSSNKVYPWPIPLNYAGNFVSPRSLQLALADSNGNIWQQVIENDGSLNINSRSVVPLTNAVLKTPQLAITGSPPAHSSGTGITGVPGQIATDNAYVYWCVAPSTWVRAAYTQNTW